MDFAQVAALGARSAAGLASRDDLGSMLAALASELGKLDDVAGAQVVIAEGNDSLQLMGSAGFAADPEFFGLLAPRAERGRGPRDISRAVRNAPDRDPGPPCADACRQTPGQPLHAYLREVVIGLTSSLLPSP